MIIPHLASRLKPVNGLQGGEYRFVAMKSTGFAFSCR